jgi:hypothetical protein
MTTTQETPDKGIAWQLSALNLGKSEPNMLIFTLRDIEVASVTASLHGEQCSSPTDPC